MSGIYTKNLWLYNLTIEALLLCLTTLGAYNILHLSVELRSEDIENNCVKLDENFCKINNCFSADSSC